MFPRAVDALAGSSDRLFEFCRAPVMRLSLPAATVPELVPVWAATVGAAPDPAIVMVVSPAVTEMTVPLPVPGPWLVGGVGGVAVSSLRLLPFSRAFTIRLSLPAATVPEPVPTLAATVGSVAVPATLIVESPAGAELADPPPPPP